MIKYLKWICLIIAITGICILGVIFIKNNSKPKKIKEDTFKIINIQNTAWIENYIEIYKNKALKDQITFMIPNNIIFSEKQIQYTDSITNQINYYKYEYKNGILTIYSDDKFHLKGSYNISLENEQLKLTQEENNQLKVYYFTKAAG